MKRWIPFLIFGLILAGAAVVISSYAEDQAELIVEGAPAASEDDDEISEAQLRACERAHTRYNAIWDESLEHPGDHSYEEKLEVAMGDVLQNCEGQ